MNCRLLKRSRNVIAREPLATVAISNHLIIGRRDCFASLAMTLKRVFQLTVAVLVSTNVAFGFSDLEAREKRSAAINSIRKSDCGEEDAKIRKLIEYASALVFHNETEEAKATLLTAAKQAKSPPCRQALEKTADGL
jgi:hypothetical protein